MLLCCCYEAITVCWDIDMCIIIAPYEIPSHEITSHEITGILAVYIVPRHYLYPHICNLNC